MGLNQKRKEFQNSIYKYNTSFFYKNIGLLASSVIVILQIITTINLFTAYQTQNILTLFFLFVVSYIITDFINGVIHMYMDNNTNYTSIVGPFIAVFHLHHKQPIYKSRNILAVYFYESGSKHWLVVFLIVIVYLQHKNILSLYLNFVLVCVGILSSLAEVSHYLCHNSKKSNKIITILQKNYIFLSKKHHILHHKRDNINYAFLNGITDPVLNLIAKYMYDGYKDNADKHALEYTGDQTSNRSLS